mmetsp:Transcript_35815/g.41783  ORF Transcript_35815/g.41783 Transcript_35815/m.41783 type:complete len:246 (-) Transcript_35815:247-984(-)
MFAASSTTHASSRLASKGVTLPTGWIFSTPFLPSSTRELKNGTRGSTFDSTNVHSTMPWSPRSAFSRENANSAPAYAIDRVAEPVPFLAFTTSSPPYWMRCVMAASFSSAILKPDWVIRGTIVGPLWPPTTVTLMSNGLAFSSAATNVFARTMSSVVTPNSLRGSNTPAFFSTSAAMGTVLLTGFEMIPIIAFGHVRAHSSARLFTIDAFVLNRSSRVMPGLRGTPAGMITMSAPARALAASSRA